MEIDAVVDDSAAEGSGIAHAPELLAFTEAAVRGSEEELRSTRDALVEAAGVDAMVDAACVVGNFLRMTRIADGTGIPLDGPVGAMSADIQSDLGLTKFGSAANSPRRGAVMRALARHVRPVLMRVMQRRFRREGGSESESGNAPQG